MFITLQYLYAEDLTPNMIVLNLEMGTLGSNSKKKKKERKKIIQVRHQKHKPKP